MAATKAAFFFGSGISRDSGAPMVPAITKALLEDAWKAESDWRFYPRPSTEGKKSIGVAQCAQDLLHIVKHQIDPHLLARERRTAHYEDLYAAVLQILQDERGEITNPLISQAAASIRSASSYLHVGHDFGIDHNAFASLLERTTDLIQWVVWQQLAKAGTPKGMDVVVDVAKTVNELDVFTLNHDTILEARLSSGKVDFDDGFATKGGDIRRFDARWEKPVRLYKLHGSTNWYLVQFPKYRQYGSITGNPDFCRDEANNLLSTLDPKPEFLTGTTVKEQTYGIGLFGELFTRLRDRLSKHRHLICCGYGFGDRGINRRLRQWFLDSDQNRFVILHNGSIETLARYSFWQGRWKEYHDAGRVIVIPNWLSECTLAQLQPFFDSSA